VSKQLGESKERELPQPLPYPRGLDAVRAFRIRVCCLLSFIVTTPFEFVARNAEELMVRIVVDQVREDEARLDVIDTAILE
jgi:hypothetical protein